MSDPAIQTSHVLPYAAREARPFGRMPRLMLAIAWAYPLLPLGALYLTWVAAWIVLGHQPRSSLDDPKSISPFVDVPYIITALLLVSMPIGMLIGVIVGMLFTPWWVHSRGGRITTSVVLIAALLALYVGAFVLLRWDPAHVLYWYMD